MGRINAMLFAFVLPLPVIWFVIHSQTNLSVQSPVNATEDSQIAQRHLAKKRQRSVIIASGSKGCVDLTITSGHLNEDWAIYDGKKRPIARGSWGELDKGWIVENFSGTMVDVCVPNSASFVGDYKLYVYTSGMLRQGSFKVTPIQSQK